MSPDRPGRDLGGAGAVASDRQSDGDPDGISGSTEPSGVSWNVLRFSCNVLRTLAQSIVGACAVGSPRVYSESRRLRPVPGACAASTGRLRSQYRALAQPVPGACAAGSSRGHRGSRRLRGGCPARAPCVLPGLPCHSGRQADTGPRLLQCGSPGHVLNANGAGSMWLLDSNGGVDIRSRARDCRGGARPPEEPLFAFRETRGLIAITPGGGRACSRSVLATTFALISRGLHAARGVLSRPA